MAEVAEIEEAAEPGELAPAAGAPDGPEESDALTDEQEAALLSLVRRFDDQERHAQNWAIITVWRRRMMERGFADAAASVDSQQFQVSPAPEVGLAPAGMGGDTVSRPPVGRSYNVFAARERTWAAAFSQTPPGLRFEPADPDEPDDVAGAEAANTMRRIIEKFNPPRKLAQRAARLCWTDGRLIAVTEFVRDKQQYGVDRTGKPKGREEIHLYGMLESKVPIVCEHPRLFPYVKIEDDLDETIAKAMYPDVASKITDADSSSNVDSTFARLARITCAEGQGNGRNGGGATSKYLRTRSRWWLRPEAFHGVSDPEMRQALQDRYPEGCCLTYFGSTLAEERPECMDEHIAVMHALDGDGQARPSVGDSMMDPQRVTNELLGMVEETFRYVIPMTLVNDNLIDVDAVQDMRAGPGCFVPVEKNTPGPMSDDVHETSPAQVPPELMGMLEQLIGPLADKLSSTPPVLGGASMENQDTARGYALARDQALGVIGLTWQPYRDFYAEAMGQAVRLAGISRDKGPLKALVAAASGRSVETVSLHIGDLRGDFVCVPETDANFPEGYTARSNKIMMLLNNAASSPAVSKLLMQPDNQALLLDAIGVEGLVDESVVGRNNQLAEIQEMEKAKPVPNPDYPTFVAQAQLAAQAGQPVQTPAPPEFFSSVPIDPDFDDHEAHFAECVRWINSAAGQEARKSDPDMVANVKLHALAHRQELQQQQEQQKPPQKPPAEVIAFKDVAAADPMAARQMLQQAGLTPGQPAQ
jgi:hypothetical protein